MAIRDAFLRGFARAAAKSPLYSEAIIYRSEAPGKVMAYDDAGQMVYRETEVTHDLRDLPRDKAENWLGNYEGAVTLSVLTELLLDSSFVIRLKGVLYAILEVQAGDVAGVHSKVLAKPLPTPHPVLLDPYETWPK